MYLNRSIKYANIIISNCFALFHKNTQAMDFIDDECIIMDKIYGDDNNNSINNNKQLITEEQFQTALIINVSLFICMLFKM